MSHNEYLKFSEIFEKESFSPLPKLPSQQDDVRLVFNFSNSSPSLRVEDSFVDFNSTVLGQASEISSAGPVQSIPMIEKRSRPEKRRVLSYGSVDYAVKNEKPSTLKSPKTTSVVFSNVYGLAKQNYAEKLEKLGATIVDHVAEADLVFTSKAVKYSAKMLAAVCKGIPIVNDSFLVSCLDAGKLLNPEKFIISDFETDFRAGRPLSQLLMRESKGNLFSNFKVFKSKSSRILFEDLTEIVENGGGQSVKFMHQIGKHEPILYIFNMDDVNELRLLSHYYTSVNVILEQNLINLIFRQILVY